MHAFNFLVLMDNYNNEVLRPELAKEWSFDNSGLVLTLKLVQNAKWHDGTPFTSKDVIYTLSSHMTPPAGFNSNVTRDLNQLVKEFRAPDDFTVVIEFNRVSNQNFINVKGLVILPAHLDIDTAHSQPVGTGPFKLKSFERDISAEWERNPDYFDKDDAGRQLPYLDGLKFFQFADRTLFLSALRTGRIKYSAAENKPAVQTAVDQLEKDVPGIQLDWHSSGTFGPTFKNIPPFNDPKVREAIDLWLDRKSGLAIVQPDGNGGVYDVSLLSQEREGVWGLPPEEIMNRPGYRLVDSTGKVVTTIQEYKAKFDELRKDPRDRQRAKELLAEAGIKPGDVKFEVAVVSFEVPRGGPVFIAQMKELFDATWTMKAYATSGQFTTDINDGKFSLFWTSHGANLTEPSATLRGHTDTGSTSHVALALWRDDPFVAKIAQLYDQQDATLDPAKRRPILWDIQRTILDWRGKLHAWSTEGPAAYWPDVRNVPNIITIRDDKRLDRIWLAR
jgi:peptide/nickel transport system substrate-binding protein